MPGSGPRTATMMADRQLTGWLRRVHETEGVVMNGTAVVIGGLAVAGGLTRAGWQVAVLERADAFTEVDPTKKRATKGVR